MGLATHLGPWLLGTVKNTTGTTAGTIRNVGASPVIQFKTVAFGDTAASQLAVLPAGAMIQNIQLIQTTTFTSAATGSVIVLLNGTQIAQTANISTGSAGTVLPVPATAASSFNNIGSVDGIITYTMSTLTAGAGTLVIAYVVRNADGSIAPTAFTGP